MSTHTANLDTPALLADILNPEQPASAICDRHAISYQQLVEFLDAPFFTQFTNAVQRLSQVRNKLIALETSPKALEALIETTSATEETRAVNETIRKSATKFLTIANQITKRPTTGCTDIPPVQSQTPQQNNTTNKSHTQKPTTGGTGVSPVQSQTPHQNNTLNTPLTQPSTTCTHIQPIQYHIPISGQAIPSITPTTRLITAAGSTHTYTNTDPPN